MDALRELVTLYVATEAKQIAGSEQCLLWVEEGGQFPSDLLFIKLERLK